MDPLRNSIVRCRPEATRVRKNRSHGSALFAVAGGRGRLVRLGPRLALAELMGDGGPPLAEALLEALDRLALRTGSLFVDARFLDADAYALRDALLSLPEEPAFDEVHLLTPPELLAVERLLDGAAYHHLEPRSFEEALGLAEGTLPTSAGAE
jgi:hypothetical protein